MGDGRREVVFSKIKLYSGIVLNEISFRKISEILAGADNFVEVDKSACRVVVLDAYGCALSIVVRIAPSCLAVVNGKILHDDVAVFMKNDLKTQGRASSRSRNETNVVPLYDTIALGCCPHGLI